MRIVVCIKQVPSSGDVTVDPVTHNLVREKAGSMLNPSDYNAIEAALLLREQLSESGSDCKVAAVTMGPPDAQEVLRTAMAMGADEACLLTDRQFAGGDTIATATVLAAGIEKYGAYDLIIAGAESSDGATGQVGPMVAERLSIPHIAMVQEMEAATDSLIAVKKMNGTRIKLKASMPALVTVRYGANEPRLATLRSRMAAKKKPIVTYTNEELGLPRSAIGAEGSPTVVTESFRPEIVNTCEFMTGNPKEIARQMLALIEKERGNS